MKHKRIEGDCLEVMRDLPRGYFDLLLTDPPYAMPATFYEGRNAAAVRHWSDSSILTGWWRGVVERVLPLLKANAMVAVFANANAVAAFWPVLFETTTSLNLAVWDKGRFGMGHPLRNQAEYIVVGSVGAAFGRSKGVANVFNVAPIHHDKRVHPAQKPRDLLIALARQLCPDGGRVLDPFAGSFSTEAACESLGLSCTSIEWGEAFAMPDEQVQLFR